MSETKTLVLNFSDSTFDKIYAYYIDSEKHPLTTNQIETKNRWLSAYTIRCKGHSKSEVANRLIDQYNISRSQAYRYIQNAEKLFGKVEKTDRDGSLAVLRSYSHKLYRMALKSNDLEMMEKAIKLIGKYSELDAESEAMYNPEKFENTPLKFTISKTAENIISSKMGTGIVDFNKTQVEDTSFEEIE